MTRPAASRIALVLAVVGLALALGPNAGANSFKVTTIGDSGPGSLRQAITDANAHPGADRIVFAIGSGPHAIAPSSQLPTITGPVVIDGRTQPGFPGTPLIMLDGLNAIANGFVVTHSGTVIRSLSIVEFTAAAIDLVGNKNKVAGNYIGIDPSGNALANLDGVLVEGDSNVVGGGGGAVGRNVISANSEGVLIDGGVSNLVQNNFIGTNPTATAAAGNGDGVDITGGAKTNRVGTGTAAGRNIISGNIEGISLDATTGNRISGNYIGTDAAGLSGIANADEGITLEDGAIRNIIGGTTVGARNVIGGGGDDGVNIQGATPPASNNVVTGNLIGIAADNATPLGNVESGLNLSEGATKNRIGANRIGFNGNGVLFEDSVVSNVVQGNEIISNTAEGVSVTGALKNLVRGNTITSNALNGVHVDTATGITISRNSIAANTGLGIALTTGGNASEPAPSITDIRKHSGTTTFKGTATSGTHRFELFTNTACDGSGFGEGSKFIGAATVSGGNWSVTVGRTFPPSTIFTATSTNTATGNTSEFSACVVA